MNGVDPGIRYLDAMVGEGGMRTQPRPMPATTEGEGRAAFRLTHVSQIEARPPSWLVRGLIENDALALVFGDPGSYKTFLAIEVACCVATGTDCYGMATRQGPVVYIAGEGRNGLRRRFSAWETARQIDLSAAPLFLSEMPAALTSPENAALVVDAIEEVSAASGPPALIVVDTVARNFGPGDENSTQDMSAFVAGLDWIRSASDATVLLVHHSGHGDKGRARGAMALRGALDSEYRMEKGEDGMARLHATKMKDAAEPEPLAFRVREVELPGPDGEPLVDEDGLPVTSIVLHPTEFAPPPTKGRQGSGKWQGVGAEALAGLYTMQRENLLRSGHDPDGARVLVSDWREAMRARGAPRNRVHDVPLSLAEAGKVRMEHGYAYLL